jgi:GDPmannose 4,6-dehydratase
MPRKEVAFITGITGQDGSYLAEFLLEKGYDVVGLSRRTTHQRYENIEHLAGKIALEFGDMIDPTTIEHIVAEYKPNEVYNLAAQSVPADSWRHPMATGEITALGNVRVLEALRKHKPDARFYQATSREIYGGVRQEIINEESPIFANNPYGIAKLYSHLMTINYRDSYGMFACSGILFNHESPRRGLHFVTRKVTSAAAAIKLGIKNPPLNENGKPLVEKGKLKLGDLDSIRDWGYAKEYVVAMWAMLQQDNPKDYVIATNTKYSVKDLCRLSFGYVGLDWQEHVESDSGFMRPTEIEVQRGDYSKAKSELGWEPKTLFPELVKLMVQTDLDKFKRALD